MLPVATVMFDDSSAFDCSRLIEAERQVLYLLAQRHTAKS
jgi:hypothetical protein